LKSYDAKSVCFPCCC